MKTTKYADLEALCAANRHLKKIYFASEIGVSPSRFSKLKNGTLRPTDDEASAIASLLGQPVAYVFRLYGKDVAA